MMVARDQPAATNAARARAALVALRAEVAKAVIGQDAAVTGLVIALLCRGHVLLEGVPGVAKTLLVRALAAALALDTKRVQFTPDLMPGDVTGSLVYDARTAEFSFRAGPVFTNLLLADEINRTPPKTQASLLEAMEERQVSVEGTPRPLPEPFVVVATQNPIEYEGTYPLPEAQLDRFLLKLTMPVPGRPDEIRILGAHHAGFDPRDLTAAGLTAVAGPAELAAGRQAARAVSVAPEVLGYIVDVARATRSAPSLSLGASPRAATALLASAKAWAWLSGRDFLTPDDVKALARQPCGTGSACGRRPNWKGSPPTGCWTACWPRFRCPADQSGQPRRRRCGAGGHVALTGRAGLLGLLGVLVVAVIPPHLLTLAVVDGALAVGIVVDLTRAGRVRDLVIQRGGSQSTRLGEPTTVTLDVVNTGRRRVRGRLRDAWPPSAGSRPDRHALELPPGARRRLETVLVPTRRGDRRPSAVTVRSIGPLGLAARQGRHQAAWSVRVLPPFTSRRFLPERLSRLRLLDGLVTTNVRGQGTEFDSLREYVVGDDVRSIDWRATARRQDVVVRTWRPERDRRIVLVLDTGRTSAARVGDIPRLDSALDAAPSP